MAAGTSSPVRRSVGSATCTSCSTWKSSAWRSSYPPPSPGRAGCGTGPRCGSTPPVWRSSTSSRRSSSTARSSRGVLSVVSPVVSTFPAVTAILAFLFLPEGPTPLAVGGIIAALLGVILISRAEAHPDNPTAKDARKGLVSAVLCFLGYGVFYFALKFVVSDLGVLTTAACTRGVGVAAISLAILVGVADVRRLPREFVPALTVVGVLDSCAFITYNVGIALGSVAIVGTLSGLSSAVTVGLAVLILRERLVAVQYAGLASIFVGLVLMAVA